jgi:hypothetical protein
MLITSSKDFTMRFWKIDSLDVIYEDSVSDESSSDSDNQFLPTYDDNQFIEMEKDFQKSIPKRSESNSNLVNMQKMQFRLSQGSSKDG